MPVTRVRDCSECLPYTWNRARSGSHTFQPMVGHLPRHQKGWVHPLVTRIGRAPVADGPLQVAMWRATSSGCLGR
ncbi:hypothetical protein B296_00057364 [Ensete ventricosum]|uniref:Uncharacterized protein n=1 Tax=Ensete ventricosum TaxID=4639 RepID=A0A426XRM9_ENSVE|nr:hypothetical protein B296_00057364 [Ensete ventricosum]